MYSPLDLLLIRGICYASSGIFDSKGLSEMKRCFDEFVDVLGHARGQKASSWQPLVNQLSDILFS